MSGLSARIMACANTWRRLMRMPPSLQVIIESPAAGPIVCHWRLSPFCIVDWQKSAALKLQKPVC